MLKLNTQLIIKKLLDLFLAFLMATILLPLLIFISLIIKFDGPIFFLQNRLGKDGKVFTCIKFRTMVVNADNYLDNKGIPIKDRVTKFGKFLRKTSLDETPQLINIMMGQMSFIGPRPTLVSHWNKYTSKQKSRFKMSPGITGWAQVNGRNKIPWSKRIELDIEYIENFSLMFDFIIFTKTIKVVLQRKNIELDRNSPNLDDLGDDKNK